MSAPVYSEGRILMHIPWQHRVCLWFCRWRWTLSDDGSLWFGSKIWRGRIYVLRVDPTNRGLAERLREGLR
jgi:hypothetical protein